MGETLCYSGGRENDECEKSITSFIVDVAKLIYVLDTTPLLQQTRLFDVGTLSIIHCVKALIGDRPVEFLSLQAPPVAGAVYKAAREAGYALDMPAIVSALHTAGL